MATEKLLLVFIVQILDHEQAADVVDKSVLHGRVVRNCIGVLAIVANRVVHLQ